MNNKITSLPNISTNRHLIYYEKMLGFSRELLQEKNVIDFWSWSSDIGNDLKHSWIISNVINFDLSIKTKVNWVRWDATAQHLPFKNDCFDILLSLWSLYQIDHDKRSHVIQEMMRISKTIHIGPVYQHDIDIIEKLCSEMNYEMILCQPQKFSWYSFLKHIKWLRDIPWIGKITQWISIFQRQAKFMIEIDDDYDIYKKIELEKRIIKTEQRTAKILYSPNWDPLIQQGDARLCILKKLKL